MKQEDIIAMAREVGFETHYRKGKIHGFDRDGDYTDELKAFAALVAAAEREACAQVCVGYGMKGSAAVDCAAAIRARGQA